MEYVYVLTNEAIPGMVKIGRTAQNDVRSRIDQLYTTGVPVPFKIEFSCRVENSTEVEQALHRAFAPLRVNIRREFFRIEPEQAIAILELLHVGETTVEVALQPSSIDQVSINAAEQLRARRPSLNFVEMQIPVGAELFSVQGETTVLVTGPKRVRLGDEEMSLTAATKQILQIEYSVSPCPHWLYEGRILSEIYSDTYQRND